MKLNIDDIKSLPGNTQLFRLACVDTLTMKSLHCELPHPRGDLNKLRAEARSRNSAAELPVDPTRLWEVRTVYAKDVGFPAPK